MTVILNGEKKQFDCESLTIPGFLDAISMAGQPVLIELNGKAILVREFDRHSIQDGDTVEVIRMVAGG